MAPLPEREAAMAHGNRKHLYGDRVLLVNSVILQMLLAEVCMSKTPGYVFNELLREIYERLIEEFAETFAPKTEDSVMTRMENAVGDRARLRFPAFDSSTPITLVNVVRAGGEPSYAAFNRLSRLGFTNVHIDTFFAERETDEKGAATGETKISGTKIGSEIAGRAVVITDPMGATGGTPKKVLKVYQDMGLGKPQLVVLLHCIITPEYLWNVVPALEAEGVPFSIMALRVDRGMSDQQLLLTTAPGERLKEERGLNDKKYIVPGGGGFGEIGSGN